MKDFFAYIFTHRYVGAIIVVLLVITVIMWIKAVASSQRRREERDAEIARIEREKALRNEFRTLDEEKINNTENERLLYGVAANIQMFLEKQENMNAAFEALPEEKKNIYALNYVFEDGKDSELSMFFKANGQPLTGTADRAVREIIGGGFSEVFTSLYNMTDDDTEVSYDEEKIGESDKKYAEIMACEKSVIFGKIADYIRQNKAIFID